jgi:hypothetical protein
MPRADHPVGQPPGRGMLDAGRLDTPHTRRVLRQLHTLGSLADDVELPFVNVVEFLGDIDLSPPDECKYLRDSRFR